MKVVTPDMLRKLCAEPEPSTEGTWFMVNLEDLQREGHTHIEFHFPDGSETPNDIRLYTAREAG
jgi:hypothetical protein